MLAPPAPPAPSAPAADAVVWNVIKDGAAPDPFEAFLRIYPDSQYAGAARAKLAALAKPAPLPPAPAVPTPTMEGLIWAMIKDGASAGPFEEYLQTYPNGAHAGAARAKLAALARLAASAKHAPPPPAPAVPTPAMEGMIWAMIKDSAAAGPFEEYLQSYPNGDHAGAARAKLAELARAPPTPQAALPPAAAESADRAPPQTALLTPPAAPSALALDGRWMGDAPATPGCWPLRMQFEVTGNRISGAGARAGSANAAYTATVSGTIAPDGIGTFEWGQNGATGTIKFTGGRFEARMPGTQGCGVRIFAGERTQTALLTPPAAPSALALDGRWMGDAAAVPGWCGASRMQFEVTGNRISGTAAGRESTATTYTTTVSGTIDADGIGTFEWGVNGATGTIKFTGDRFEARVRDRCEVRIFAGGRTQ